jgi:C1A family cysteine protease
VPQVSRMYRIGPILDQGFTSSCVGHAWRQWLSSALMMTKAGPKAMAIYQEAQKVDEWEGEDYEGTSVRAGVKVLKALGHVASYVWSWDADVLRDYMLSGLGVVVVGTNFYESMFTPDSKGYLKVEGEVVGGHAYVLGGYSVERQAHRMINSWGTSWGEKGRAWLHHSDLRRLLSEDGEGAAATEQRVEPATAA